MAIWRHVKKKVSFHVAQRFFIVLLNEYFFNRRYLKYSFYILFSIEMRRVSFVGPTALFFGTLAILSVLAIQGADGFNRESSSRSGFRNKTEASREGKLCEYAFLNLGECLLYYIIFKLMYRLVRRVSLLQFQYFRSCGEFRHNDQKEKPMTQR